jgi:arylsulfatase A-like enzyme/Tfp pilus assembly protein PilF
MDRGSVAANGMLQNDIGATDVRNVVIISIDTCRADHLSCYGYSRRTSPNIDALGAEGIMFNHAVTSIPTTLPSHASMLTGTVPLYHKVRDNNNYRLAPSNVTLAEILKDNGFVTGAVIGAFVLDSQFGLEQGFDTYEDIINLTDKQFLLYNERDAMEVTRLGSKWLEEHRGDRFFLFLHYFDPHAPYKPHKEFVFSSFPFFILAKDRYDGEIAYTDHFIGQVIDKLKSLDLYDSTLIIVTGDHGEGLGEHGERAHSYFIYHSTLHVPMIMRIPGGPEGAIIQETVGLVDIVPTVCGILGIRVPANVQGKNLGPLFSGNSGAFKARSIYCESLMPTKFGLDPLFGLVSGQWKYIHTSNPELYDLKNDPHETRNLVNQHGRQAGVMQDKLRFILDSSDVTELSNSKVAINEETRKRLQSLGYLAGQRVDDEIQFEQKGSDPKVFIEFCDFAERFPRLLVLGKTVKAKKLCNEMLKKRPDMPQLYYCLGLAAVREKDLDSIIIHFSRYLSMVESASEDHGVHIKSDYDLALAHGNLGIAFNYKGETEKAKEHLRKALVFNPYELQSILQLALIDYRNGAINDAVTYYTRALDINPDLPEAHFYLGNSLFQGGNIQEAIIHYNKALQLRPGWAEALGNLRTVQAKKSQQQRTQPDSFPEDSGPNISQ